MSKTLVFDNGAGSLKAGLAGETRPSHTMPNCTAKLKGQTQTLVGDETSYSMRDSSAPLSILRPFDRGYIINWEPEFEVWRRMLGRHFLNVDPAESRLLATEAPFGPLVLQEAANEVVFEELGFAACYRCPSAALSCYHEQMLEEERETALKEQLKAKRAEMEEKAAIAAAEAAAKAKAEEEAARAAAARAAAAAGIVHGRGTRMSTGVLVGGSTRQRYDPTDPDGTMGLASSRRNSTNSSVSQSNSGSQSRSSRGSNARSGSSRARSPSRGSTAGERGRKGGGGTSTSGNAAAADGGGEGGGVGGSEEGSVAGDVDDEDRGDEEEEEEEESSEEEDEDPEVLLLNFVGKKGDLSQLLPAQYRKGPMSDVCIVVDSGFSFTHILPFYQGRALHKSALRLNVGGKLLTNYLKEIVSYRQWNMMDEFELMQDVKDSLCYVSLDLNADLRASRRMTPANTIVREFVLPDRKTVMKGYPREVDWQARAKRRQQEELGIDDDQQLQVLTMGNERFHVPEILFHPSNIGLRQMGLSEAIDACINRCPEPLRPQLYANVLLTGGNCCMPNLRERVYRDLRVSAPEHCEVNVALPDEPALHAWRGGSLFASSPEFLSFAVSKQEYDEFGHTICNMRFADWCPVNPWLKIVNRGGMERVKSEHKEA